MVEQECPYQECDERDRHSWHVFLHDEQGIAAYLRVIDAGVQCQHVAIGRVLTTRRGQGLGSRILKEEIRGRRKDGYKGNRVGSPDLCPLVLREGGLPSDFQ